MAIILTAGTLSPMAIGSTATATATGAAAAAETAFTATVPWWLLMCMANPIACCVINPTWCTVLVGGEEISLQNNCLSDSFLGINAIDNIL